MSAEVKPSTFTTGPEDAWAAVDIYATTTAIRPAAPAEPETVGAVAKAASNLVGTVVGKVKEAGLGKLVKAAYKKDKETEKQILAQLKDVTAGAVSQAADLKTDLVQSVLTSAGLNSEKAASLTGVILAGGDIKQAGINALVSGNPKLEVLYSAGTLISNADLNSTTGIVNMINGISGNSELGKVLNMEGTFKFLGKVADLASKAQMASDFIERVMDKIHGHKNKKKFMVAISRNVIMSGNMDMIKKMITYAGGPAVMAKIPDAIQLLMMSYRLPPGVAAPTMGHYTELVGVLNSLNGNWAKYNRNGVWISDLSPFSYMSAAAERVMRLGPDYVIEVAIARSYPSRRLPSLGKALFPMAAY